MTDISEYREARTRHHELSVRLVWSAPAVNAAGLLAITNIVAGAPSPDTALVALTGPLAAFAAGIWLGGQAVQQAMNAAAKGLVRAIGWDQCEQIIRRQAVYRAARTEMPMAMDLARLVHGDEAEERVRDLYAQVLARSNLSEQKEEADFRAAQAVHEQMSREIATAERWMRVWHSMSVAACAVAILWAIIQPHFGVRLERAEAPQPVPSAAIPR